MTESKTRDWFEPSLDDLRPRETRKIINIPKMTVKEALETWNNGNRKDVYQHLILLSKAGKHGLAERFGNDIYNKLQKDEKRVFFKLVLEQMIYATGAVDDQ